jgi:hypothetical protein
MVFLQGVVHQFVGVFASVKFVHIKRRHNLHAARLAHEAITRQFEKEDASASESEEEKEPTKGTDELSDEDFYEHPRGIKKKLSSTRKRKSRTKHATPKPAPEGRNQHELKLKLHRRYAINRIHFGSPKKTRLLPAS